MFVDPRYFRPTEVDTLLGDPKKAAGELGWKPEISFEQMVREMVAYDLNSAAALVVRRNSGFDTSLQGME